MSNPTVTPTAADGTVSDTVIVDGVTGMPSPVWYWQHPAYTPTYPTYAPTPATFEIVAAPPRTCRGDMHVWACAHAVRCRCGQAVRQPAPCGVCGQ